MITPRRAHRILKREIAESLPYPVARRVVTRPNNPFVPHDDQSRSIFIHVPKVAGTSFKSLFFGTEQEIPANEDGWRELQAGGVWPRGHRRIADYYLFDAVRAESYFKFAFVRNPWDRLLSAYSYLTTSPDRTPADTRFADRYLTTENSFEKFVMKLPNPVFRMLMRERVHFRSQASFLCLAGQKGTAMDFVGRFENLSEDTETILTRLGKPVDAIPHVRASKRGDYRSANSARMQQIVGDVYAADVRLFGYDF